MRYLPVLATLLALTSEARPVRVCVSGDSILRGYSPSTYGVDVPLMQLGTTAGLDFGVKNVAHPADVAADAAALVNSEVVGRNCTHLVLLIGTNDLVTGTAAATVYTTINAIATAAEAAGVKVVLCSVLPRATAYSFTKDLGTRIGTLNGSLLARSGSIFADTFTALTGTAGATSNAPAWQAATAYSLNDVRVNGGKAYVVTTAGTSAGSGGPTGTGTSITDGSVVWDYAPALGTEYGGGTDGLHPGNAGQSAMAVAINAAVVAAGGWQETARR